MDQETCMVKQIRSLDSDMQTLVYENYNKFISATDTIRKMKNDFKKMEDEMDCLSANMAAITEFSACISGTLQDQHTQITKLSGVHTLLRKLQFLFELPARLNKCLELQAYAQAVSSYRRARCVLQQYSHLPSFRGIQDDCHTIMEELAQELRQKFRFVSLSSLQGEFCSQGVRESLVVNFIKFVCQSSRQFCESAGDKGGSTPPVLLLLLSRLCLDYETSTISYILTLTDEQFLVQHHSPVTPVTALCAEAREAAQKLLNHYVKVQGLIISQMLRKSVETRDWVNTIEPRNVRAVMKRVVEDTTSIDVQVGLLYEEGVRKAHSSDSSKRTFSVYSSSRQQARYAASYTPSAPIDTNLLSNIHKLFSERIDIFSSVEFNKVSVMTGIIKISLKTFLECVRLRTFGRYGLQQIQVDCHYLQMYLWRFVSDENLVHFLLDEIVCSSAHRCLDPAPMEQSVIEVICERG
uniref:Vacuolar protein sorting-associated protein 51 homolog n=1 Tax=Cynoglossus semilaevis TaxID=244447 RepID=A0A3P8WES1_CYNSE